jgi:hypothetical protein
MIEQHQARGRVCSPLLDTYHRRPASPVSPLATAVDAVVTMPAKRNPHRYTGALASPIIWPFPPAFWGAATEDRTAKYWKAYARHQKQTENVVRRLVTERLSLLMDHYGISDKEDMAALAFALAFEHVPGFKIVTPKKSNKGRKRKWDSSRLENLFETVESIKRQHSYSDRQVLKFMVNNERHAVTWGPPSNHKGSQQQWIETLESRLQEAKRIRRDVQSHVQALRRIAQELAPKFRNSRHG